MKEFFLGRINNLIMNVSTSAIVLFSMAHINDIITTATLLIALVGNAVYWWQKNKNIRE